MLIFALYSCPLQCPGTQSLSLCCPALCLPHVTFLPLFLSPSHAQGPNRRHCVAPHSARACVPQGKVRVQGPQRDDVYREVDQRRVRTPARGRRPEGRRSDVSRCQTDPHGRVHVHWVEPAQRGHEQCPAPGRRWSSSNFSYSLTRNITSHSMENLAFHSLLRWKMIMLPILMTSLIHLSLKGWENILFELGSEAFHNLLKWKMIIVYYHFLLRHWYISL